MVRAAGILMPITSLPSPYGIGTLGQTARDFIQFLEKSGQTYWQILPICPTGYGDSPYQSSSTFAGNPYMIDLNDLVLEGLLQRADFEDFSWGDEPEKIDYKLQYEQRFVVLKKSVENVSTNMADSLAAFLQTEAYWLDDYALYMAVKNHFGGTAWSQWPEPVRLRDTNKLEELKTTLAEDILFWKTIQFLFFHQWNKLKAYASQHHIQIIGDLPIYVSEDSADVWAHPEQFQLNEELRPTEISGCPPDGFSEDGQLWGNPLYDWKKLKASGYDWWVQRMKHCLELYDVVRIDHFRGFDEYYAIPYGEKTARKGEWEKGPGMDLFNTLNKKLENLHVIAEDLGFLTESVLEMLKESGYPGMKVLQFAFDGSEDSAYLPYKYEHNCVVYTGTHDNETTKGWLEGLQGHDRDFVREYINCYEAPVNDCVWGLIRIALASVADLAVIPIQDYLCLGNEARMNAPATLGDNWKWRLTRGQISDMTLYHMREVTRIYGRLYREPVAEEPEEETEIEETEIEEQIDKSSNCKTGERRL